MARVRKCDVVGDRMIAESPLLLRFFVDIEENKFEIAADSFATFRVRHRHPGSHTRMTWTDDVTGTHRSPQGDDGRYTVSPLR